MTVLKAISRESYCGRSLISRNFGGSSEIASVVSWVIDLVSLIKFICDKYCTA